MCFLYRQSISIVYESKFKYIYRYFIKIDRCFCEILQSLPLRKCGLKSFILLRTPGESRHFPCGSVDWNSLSFRRYLILSWSLPLRKCGLKYVPIRCCIQTNRLSLPLRKCGLKFPFLQGAINSTLVTSLAEVWIEIPSVWLRSEMTIVTSLAEVWIEIASWLALSASATSLPLRKCGLK